MRGGITETRHATSAITFLRVCCFSRGGGSFWGILDFYFPEAAISDSGSDAEAEQPIKWVLK